MRSLKVLYVTCYDMRKKKERCSACGCACRSCKVCSRPEIPSSSVRLEVLKHEADARTRWARTAPASHPTVRVPCSAAGPGFLTQLCWRARRATRPETTRPAWASTTPWMPRQPCAQMGSRGRPPLHPRKSICAHCCLGIHGVVEAHTSEICEAWAMSWAASGGGSWVVIACNSNNKSNSNSNIVIVIVIVSRGFVSITTS